MAVVWWCGASPPGRGVDGAMITAIMVVCTVHGGVDVWIVVWCLAPSLPWMMVAGSRIRGVADCWWLAV